MNIITHRFGARVARFVLSAFLVCAVFGATQAFAQSATGNLVTNTVTADQLSAPFTPAWYNHVMPETPQPPQPMPMSGGWQSKPIGGRNYWGFEIGATFNWFSGYKDFGYTLTVPGSNTTTGSDVTYAIPFANPGSGIGYLLGGVIDFALSNSFSLEGKLRYVHSNVTGDDSRRVQDVKNASNSFPVVSHHSTGISYFGLDALGRIQLSPNSLYLLAGLGLSVYVGNTLDLSQHFDTAGVIYAFTNPPVSSIGGSNSLTGTYNSSRTSLLIGVGTFLPVGSAGTVLTPELMADIPLTQLYDANTVAAYNAVGGTAPDLWHIDFSLGIKFPWGGNSESDVMETRSTPQDNGDRNADNMVNLKGKVHDKAGHPIEANMTVVDLSNNEVVTTGKSNDGDYSLPVKGPGKYSVTADADGYLFGSTYFEVDDNGRILKGNHDITLATESEGRMRLLVFFDFDKDYLQPASYPELDRAIRLMKANPSMEVEIAGYTDSKGSPAYNLDLSNRRAKSVRSYLIKNGIAASRVTAHGYGMQDPIATNDTEEGRASNRRVEFVVTHK